MRPLDLKARAQKQKPELANFGIPAGFDFAAHARDLKTAEDRAYRTIFPSLGFIALVIAMFLSEGLDIVGILLLAMSIFFPLMVVGGPYLFGWTKSLIVGRSDAGKTEPRVARYLRATDEWEYHNLTTGRGFWQNLRGVELEKAVAKLFHDQGWHVETTAVTGDGGVDLRIARGARETWVQCKGYAKPVSVAAVREIAGVCSSGTAKPMLIVVNGVTGPARKEANNLEVTVWDSQQLAQFAQGGDYNRLMIGL